MPDPILPAHQAPETETPVLQQEGESSALSEPALTEETAETTETPVETPPQETPEEEIEEELIIEDFTIDGICGVY